MKFVMTSHSVILSRIFVIVSNVCLFIEKVYLDDLDVLDTLKNYSDRQ